MITSLLNKRVIFERSTQTQNETGAFIDNWIFVKSGSTSISNEIVNEINGVYNGVISITTFFMRYDGDINYSYRLKYKNVYYEILTIQEIGSKEGLILKCKKIENNNYE